MSDLVTDWPIVELPDIPDWVEVRSNGEFYGLIDKTSGYECRWVQLRIEDMERAKKAALDRLFQSRPDEIAHFDNALLAFKMNDIKTGDQILRGAKKRKLQAGLRP